MKLDLKYNLSLGALKLIALLPLPILYIISDVIFFIIYHILHYRRKVVRTNLNLAFKESRPNDIPMIERKFYRHLCDIIVESIKLLHISDKEMRKRFVVTNPELVNEISNSGASQAVLLGHYCNWEWVQAMSLYLQDCKSVVGQVYKPLHSDVMNRVILKIRSRFHLENIPQQRAARQLMNIERSGNTFIIGLISDQRPEGSNFQHWTTLLGIDTPYTTGGEKVGKRANAEFLYASIKKTKRGHYSLTYEKLTPPTEENQAEGYYTKQFLSKLEEDINEAPQYWLWSHKIWKRGIDGKQTYYYHQKRS
ncbi:MAG: lysophospholipid acyltransferase family protein [Rikenellaceae bacterium]